MRDLLPLLVLPFLDDAPSSCIVEPDGAVLFLFKMLRLDHAVVDQGEHKTIDEEAPQFFQGVYNSLCKRPRLTAPQ